MQIKKKKLLSWSGFCQASEPESKNERKRKDWQILDSCKRTEKVLKYDGDSDTNFTPVWADGFSLEFEWQQVSSSLKDSPQYYGQS